MPGCVSYGRREGIMATKTQNRRFVVIGGVRAGINAARAAKRYDPSLEVIVLEKGEFIAYNVCALPYYIANVIETYGQLIEWTPEQLWEEEQVEVWTQHEAMAIYPDEKSVMVLDRDSGEEKQLRYDTLMIATGGVPITPPVPGSKLANVFRVRALAEAIALKHYIAEHPPHKVTIIGGGYIGLEMAEACKTLGMEVTILEKFGNIMGTMGVEVTDVIEEHLQGHQIQVVKDVSLDAFEAGEDEEICVSVLANGEKQRFETDLVIIAVGVRPEVALAKGAGIEIGETGAIATNATGQTSIENIYAGGDCAEVTHLVSGEKAYIPLETTAIKQGWNVGKNAAKPGCCYFKGSVGTMVIRVFGFEIARTGLSIMEAKRLGFDVVTSTVTVDSRFRGFPGNEKLTITLLIDATSKRLLGAEMGGKEGVATRIDIFATALYNHMPVQAIAQLDLSYLPPYAPSWDPVLLAAQEAMKKVE
ncbi:hypothetical protein GF339_01310 [candidate division KSB3 bacterium]|uniref:Pyridine nucleotide-disulfide oxidoreductase n=1 Tax=candidate division KSB3 bacterium TaxID=2044937 RepID=A0A9D5Q3Z9_9BACT|nr:hypothetical protein [candidate division KSB3 bacterium]MBD3323189.1 hypothetical protein [candidate division KSB3 bacterium]